MNNKEIKDIGKVWDIIRNNEKNYRKKTIRDSINYLLFFIKLLNLFLIDSFLFCSSSLSI